MMPRRDVDFQPLDEWALAPGYRRFSVRVAPHGLPEAQGRVATPQGTIDVGWRRDGARFTLDLTAPEGTTAHVAPPRLNGTAGTETWQATCDGSPARLMTRPVALCTFLKADLPTVEVGPGRHRLGFVCSA